MESIHLASRISNIYFPILFFLPSSLSFFFFSSNSRSRNFSTKFPRGIHQPQRNITTKINIFHARIVHFASNELVRFPAAVSFFRGGTRHASRTNRARVLVPVRPPRNTALPLANASLTNISLRPRHWPTEVEIATIRSDERELPRGQTSIWIYR